ncbi:PREDICTED: beta-2-syntrophin [Myotis davidii]|uniref:beta-2-syntrophin n=1 Tax=Myotis davidii TaxID=225400 RepID=UPI000767CE4A|nr:PREDICTED: beta-2-syntrophin [Myotis davidii]
MTCMDYITKLPRMLEGKKEEIKFIREVTPYIKKPSLVSDLPWEGAAPQSPSFSGSEDSGSPKHQNSTKDRKVIPLKMCFAARNLSMPDLENRLIELHSPDSRNTLILRCKDTATAHSWFVAIHTNIMALLPQVLAELNAMLGATSTAGGSKEVKHIAWLAEQAKLDGGRQQWRPVLMAVTEKDLLLYDCMPWTRDAWASPCHSYPLVATSMLEVGSWKHKEQRNVDLGAIYLFRVETHRDLSTWTRILVQGCHAAAELIKEVSLGIDPGISLLIILYFLVLSGMVEASTPPSCVFIGVSVYGSDNALSPQTMDLHSCPKPIVFVLHTFLSAKVTRMGLLV